MSRRFRASEVCWSVAVSLLLSTSSVPAQTANHRSSLLQLSSRLAEVQGATLQVGHGIASFDAADFVVQHAAGEGGRFSSWRSMSKHDATVQTVIEPAGADALHIRWTVTLPDTSPLLRVTVRMKFHADQPQTWIPSRSSFHFIPAIKNDPAEVASDHVFRSPAAILSTPMDGVALIPDLDLLRRERPVSSFLDLRFPDGAAPEITYGFEATTVQGHKYYVPTGSPFQPRTRTIVFGCYLVFFPTGSAETILRRSTNFLWKQFAETARRQRPSQRASWLKYADAGYHFGLANFWVSATDTGEGGFTESGYYDAQSKSYRGRFSRNDIWFQSWFSNVRTAYGLNYWGKRLNHPDWVARSEDTLRLILASPGKGGLFPAIYKSTTNSWEFSAQGGGPELYYLPDAAWTALGLLQFERDLEPVPGADARLVKLANTLLSLQEEDGGFPARVNAMSLKADPVLDGTASEAMPIWFLAEMLRAGLIPSQEIAPTRSAVERGVMHLRNHALREQRFEEFETYFSCSAKPVGFFDPVSQLPAQSTLAMQWMAEAFLSAYKLFHDPKDLASGRESLDMLSLYQQVWNPPYLHLYAFGGFGVMNTDAEWNDARQSQFAETYARFFEVTQEPEYKERGVAALDAAFTLMVLPENRNVSPRTYLGTAFRGEGEGGSSENYGHSGEDDRAFQSGFDWGTGSALSGLAYYARHVEHPHLF